jgi:HD superfamily phosphodiesterase
MYIILLYLYNMIIPKLLNIALSFTKRFHIDESHALGHSINVLHYAHQIKTHECKNFPILNQQESVIYASAILHDICDKKYVDEQKAWTILQQDIKKQNLLTDTEINVIHNIISTMSYSKVKAYGFPDLHEYNMAYHVVREADLLAAYDFDRSLIYNMNNVNPDFVTSYPNACTLMDTRVMKHLEDELFITDYGMQLAKQLEQNVFRRMIQWHWLLNGPSI